MQQKFPLWKNILLIGLAAISFIYSLPNILPIILRSYQSGIIASLPVAAYGEVN